MNETQRSPTKLVEAALRIPSATLEVVQMDIPRTIYSVLREEDSYRFDLSLHPRLPNSGVCFAERWTAHRFEMPGKAFVLPPGFEMRVRSGVGTQEIVICHLPVRSIEKWFEANIAWSDRQLEATLDIGRGTIETLLLRMAEEARNPGFASELLSESLALQIAVQLHRRMAQVDRGTTDTSLAPWRLRRIDERLQDLEQVPTLAELARLCRMSVRQLSRSFRSARGMSVGAYVVAKRLERAKSILTRGETVKEVSLRMGFAQTSAFCHAFRKATGFTPSEYQKQVCY